MRIISDTEELSDLLFSYHIAGTGVALVPTMGALHRGHLSLVDLARRDSDLVVMSIFVNPLQFRPGEDLAHYPRPIEHDIEMAASHGVDILFTPDVQQMYGAGKDITITAGELATRWEGAARPGHFDGVLTVVAKLFNIARPDVAIFGQKDIQQLTLVRQMVEQLDFDVQVLSAPIIRDSDGLALSSRNVYLSAAERQSALVIPAALERVGAEWQAGTDDPARLLAVATAVIAESPGVVVDYIAVVDPERLMPVEVAAAGTVVAIAAKVGTTRLIDNVILGEEAS